MVAPSKRGTQEKKIPHLPWMQSSFRVFWTKSRIQKRHTANEFFQNGPEMTRMTHAFWLFLAIDILHCSIQGDDVAKIFNRFFFPECLFLLFSFVLNQGFLSCSGRFWTFGSFSSSERSRITSPKNGNEPQHKTYFVTLFWIIECYHSGAENRNDYSKDVVENVIATHVLYWSIAYLFPPAAPTVVAMRFLFILTWYAFVDRYAASSPILDKTCHFLHCKSRIHEFLTEIWIASFPHVTCHKQKRQEGSEKSYVLIVVLGFMHRSRENDLTHKRTHLVSTGIHTVSTKINIHWRVSLKIVGVLDIMMGLWLSPLICWCCSRSTVFGSKPSWNRNANITSGLASYCCTSVYNCSVRVVLQCRRITVDPPVGGGSTIMPFLVCIHCCSGFCPRAVCFKFFGAHVGQRTVFIIYTLEYMNYFLPLKTR